MKEKLLIVWRIIVAIGMVAITAFVVVLFYDLSRDAARRDKDDEYIMHQDYSHSYAFAYKNNFVRTKDLTTGKYLSPEMIRVFHETPVTDTLTVFVEGSNRVFLHIYSGKVAIPAQFERAWIFSEGLGGVVKDGKLGFIDHRGNLVIPYQFKYLSDSKNKIDFVFKGGYCSVIGENNKHGLIDKNGKWAIQPQYDYINKPVNGYRMIKKDDYYGLIDSTLSIVLPIQYQWIVFNKDGFLVTKDGMQYLLDFDGKTVLQPLVVDSTEELWYQTDQQNAQGESIPKLSDYCVYRIYGSCGLFDTKNNKIVTKAVFSNIKAINNNLFECVLIGYFNNGSVLINAKGEIVK